MPSDSQKAFPSAAAAKMLELSRDLPIGAKAKVNMLFAAAKQFAPILQPNPKKQKCKLTAAQKEEKKAARKARRHAKQTARDAMLQYLTELMLAGDARGGKDIDKGNGGDGGPGHSSDLKKE